MGEIRAWLQSWPALVTQQGLVLWHCWGMELELELELKLKQGARWNPFRLSANHELIEEGS